VKAWPQGEKLVLKLGVRSKLSTNTPKKKNENDTKYRKGRAVATMISIDFRQEKDTKHIGPENGAVQQKNQHISEKEGYALLSPRDSREKKENGASYSH